METFLQILLVAGPATIATLLTFFLTRKKNQQQVNSLELENVDAALEIYRKMIDDIKSEKDQLNTQYKEILDNHKILLDDHKKLLTESKNMISEVKKLHKVISDLKTTNAHLSELIEAKGNGK